MANTILVIGATGKQGGAVIDAILASPLSSEVTVFAVTRNPESGSAKALLAKSPTQIKLIKGDLSDCPAIFTAAPAPVNSLFCISVPDLMPGAKAGDEELKGKALVDAALEHGVGHFVFTSVDRHGSESDTNPTNVPHFISKANIENHLREKSAGTKMTWTILRPVAFMENFTPGFAGKIFGTVWKAGLSPTTKLQLISTADIGYFGAQAVLRPSEFAGRAISLAGDELTFDEASAAFQRAVGQPMPMTFVFVGSAMLWAIADFGLMFKFFEDEGYAADIEALRTEHPGLLSFEDWVKTSAFVPAK